MSIQKILAGLLLGSLLQCLVMLLAPLSRVNAPITCPTVVTNAEYSVIRAAAQGELAELHHPAASVSLQSVADPPGGVNQGLGTLRDLRGANWDFLCRNQHEVRLVLRRLGIAGLAEAKDYASDDSFSAKRVRLAFSRVGFSDDGMRAVVYREMSCGALCADGTLIVLERGVTEGWHIVSTLNLWVS